MIASANADLRQALQMEYSEVSNNFRTLTDIRFRLLTFLPAATATAFALKEKSTETNTQLFSVFGLVITLALLVYNTRNDQLYDELISRAAEIERKLGLHGGAFANRPRSWLKFSLLGKNIGINHGTGVGLVYAATCGLWIFDILHTTLQNAPAKYFGDWKLLELFRVPLHMRVPVLSITLSLGLLWLGWVAFKWQQEQQAGTLHRQVKCAMSQLKDLKLKDAIVNEHFLHTCASLAGLKYEVLEERAKYYGSRDVETLSLYMPTAPEIAVRAHFIALLTDLPPRWIEDVASGRRSPNT